MANLGHVLIFSLVGGVLSLIGGVLLFMNRRSAEVLARIATPFAAGVLLGATFFDLLPEALDETPAETVFTWTLLGLLFFFVLERFLHWFHHHEEAAKRAGEYQRPTAPLIVIGDTVHNAIDGVAIAVAFLVSVPTGIVTSLAVAAHEVPQEVGDFGLLLKLGWDRTRVLIINILSAFSTVPVALIVFRLGGEESFPVGPLLGLTAGFFLYISASDLIPRIHRGAKRGLAELEIGLLIAGVVLFALVTSWAHGYLEPAQPDEAPPSVHQEAEPAH